VYRPIRTNKRKKVIKMKVIGDFTDIKTEVTGLWPPLRTRSLLEGNIIGFMDRETIKIEKLCQETLNKEG